jgi:hypothetical protein
MAVLPPKGYPVLIVDSDTVTRGLFPLQALKAVTRRNQKIIKASGCVQEFELPPDNTPEFARHSRRAVGGRFVRASAWTATANTR